MRGIFSLIKNLLRLASFAKERTVEARSGTLKSIKNVYQNCLLAYSNLRLARASWLANRCTSAGMRFSPSES